MANLDPDTINAEMQSYAGFLETDVLLQFSDGNRAVTDVVVFPYLCGKCSHVHLTIQTEPGLVLNFVLPQEQADKLAAGLMNPSAVHPDMLMSKEDK